MLKRITRRITCFALSAAMIAGGLNITAMPSFAAVKKPGKATVTSITSNANGKVTVKLKKVKTSTGYQIVLATDKKFKKNKVTISTKKLSAATTKLKKGMTYYVRARAYKKSGKKTLYGKWSAIKSVFVKKKAAAHTHTWGSWVTVTAATCTKAGTRVRTCKTNASHKQTETIPATGHSWVKTSETPASCESPGSVSYTCQKCHETRTETGDAATGHSWIKTNETDPTCTMPGVITYTCKGCHKTKTEAGKPATGHSWTKTDETDPTCTLPGLVIYTCDSCHETKTESGKPAAGHSWIKTGETPASCESDGTVTYTCEGCHETKTEAGDAATGHSFTEIGRTPATCKEEGRIEYRCDACGETKTETIPKVTQHSFVPKTTPATCEQDGKTVSTCTICGEKKEETIPALGHDYEITSHTDATKEADGHTTYTCSRCKDSYTVTHAYVECDHEYERTAYSAPTCESNGSATYHCSKCGETKTEILNKTGHDWTDWVTVSEAGCDTAEVQTRTCKTCKITETETVKEASGHTLKYVDGWDVTCTSDGRKSYYLCTTCGKMFSDETCTTEFTKSDLKVPKTGHAIRHVEAKAATCQEDGCIEHYYCDNCNRYFSDAEGENPITEESTVIPKGHDWAETVTPRTCTEPEIHHYVCKKCGETKDETYGDPIGHKMEETRVEPTCTEDGYTESECMFCGHKTERIVLPATGHKYEITTELPATCTSTGMRISKCTACNDIKIEDLPTLEHDWQETSTTPPVVKSDATRAKKVQELITLINENPTPADKKSASAKWSEIKNLAETIQRVYNNGELNICLTEKKTYQCSTCKKTRTEGGGKDNDHEYDWELVTKLESTCVYNGWAVYKDKNSTDDECPAYKVETLELGNHVPPEGRLVDPNGTWEEIYTCAACGTTFCSGDLDEDHNYMTLAKLETFMEEYGYNGSIRNDTSVYYCYVKANADPENWDLSEYPEVAKYMYKLEITNPLFDDGSKRRTKTEEKDGVYYTKLCFMRDYAAETFDTIKNLHLCTEDMSDYEKAYHIYKWIKANVKYGNDNYTWEHVILDGTTTTCGGFAEVACALGEVYGLNVLSVGGMQYDNAGNIITGHRWNAVEINGKWYYFDGANGDWSSFLQGRYDFIQNWYLDEEGWPKDVASWNEKERTAFMESHDFALTRYIPTGKELHETVGWVPLTDDGIYDLIPVLIKTPESLDAVSVDDFIFYAIYEDEIKQINLTNDDVNFDFDTTQSKITYNGKYKDFAFTGKTMGELLAWPRYNCPYSRGFIDARKVYQ